MLTQAGQYGGLAWSPDGEWIAFSHGRDNSSTIGQIRPDGTGKHTAQTGGLSAFDPAWRVSAPLPSDRRPCVVEGTHRADLIRGTDRGDLIVGRGDNDTIYGLGGDGVLVGGGGHDRRYGGRGRDLFGADDHRRDVVSGGAGFDSGYFDKRLDRLTSVELDQLTGRRP